MSGKIHEYDGESVRVTYDAGRCIHAAECVHGLPRVFDPEARPWVDPNAAEVGELAAVVERCPTGALRLTRRDDGVEEAVPAENTITIDPDGPLYARGNLRVIGADGAVFHEDTRIAFCRCGASKYKPFCDGSHADAGFTDAAAIPDPKIKPSDESSGRLDVILAANGPLVFKGPVTIAGPESQCVGGGGALCRCGGSANKPFCDGAHSQIGFSDS